MFKKMKTMTDTSRQSLRATLSERITFLLCSLLFTFTGNAQAQTATGMLKNTSYSMSVGDVNGDGREDVLMKAVPRTVTIPLDDDLTIPLVIPPKVPSFALMSDAYWGYVLVPNPDPQLMQMNWTAAGSGALQFGATGQHADTVRITGAGGEFVVALNDVTKQLALVQLPGVSKAAGTVTYIHTDGLGSPVARTNAVGQMVSRTLYEPYGYVAAGATPTIGFTGHVNDANTGLIYMQQRYYDPVAGRFLSVDPVVTDVNKSETFNRYAYANNSPYKYIDPDGRFGILGAFVGAGIEIGLQLAMNRKVDNWTAVGIAGAAGMVTGGLGGVIGKAAVSGTVTTGRAVTAAAAVGGAAGATSKVAEASLTGKSTSPKEVAVAAGFGAVGGGVGAKIGLSAVTAVERIVSRPGVAGHIGTTTQGAMQQGGRIVEPATTVGQTAAQHATDVSTSYIEKRVN